MIYLEAFMVSAGFKVSELDFIYAKAAQDRLSPFWRAGRSQAARSRDIQILDSTFIYAAWK